MTIKSMTGYGESQVTDNLLTVSVEVKTVNHRFLDVVWKLPPVYSKFELKLNKIVRQLVKRGRVEIFVSRRDQREQSMELSFNRATFDEHLKIMREIAEITKIELKEILLSSLPMLLSKREIVEVAGREEINVDEEYEVLVQALQGAFSVLSEMRLNEGRELENDILGHLNRVEVVVDEIEQLVLNDSNQIKHRLLERLQRIAPDLKLDPGRIEQEAAMIADRCDVAEELSRLKSHIIQFRSSVVAQDGGKKLDFLLQEFARELNTCGAKAQNNAVLPLVVEAKSLIEKIREQSQNIE